MNCFTKSELKTRSCRRAAEVIKGHVEEGTGIHSRIFEVLIPDEYVIIGESKKGKTYREHIVPCCIIRDECVKMFKAGADINSVAEVIEKHVAIIKITFDDANLLDKKLGWKNTMPPGWKFNEDTIFDRLEKAGIDYFLYEKDKTKAA